MVCRPRAKVAFCCDGVGGPHPRAPPTPTTNRMAPVLLGYLVLSKIASTFHAFFIWRNSMITMSWHFRCIFFYQLLVATCLAK
jgi:hypothetical protein